MITLLIDREARATRVTVEEFLLRTDTTYATSVAVERLLLVPLVVEHVAHGTEVLAELYATLLTILLRLLYVLTLQASYFLDRVAIHLMILFRVHLVIIPFGVVAKTTREEFFALDASAFAPFAVVLAAFGLVVHDLLLFEVLIMLRIIARLIFVILVLFLFFLLLLFFHLWLVVRVGFAFFLILLLFIDV